MDPVQVAVALGAVVTAIATLVLAGATYWLGRKTREVAVQTHELAVKTAEEIELSRQQTEAIKDSAKTQREQFAAFQIAARPIVKWELYDYRTEDSPFGNDQWVAVIAQARAKNYGGIGAASALEFTQFSTHTHEPPGVDGEMLVPGMDGLGLVVWFEPIRNDVTFDLFADWKMKVRSPQTGEVLEARAELRCKLTNGVVICSLKSASSIVAP
jgi:hypothetical protein